MTTLVDQYGQPLNKQALTQEEATPSVTSVRNIMSTFSTAGIDPETLASVMRRADEGDAIAYLEMAEQLEEKDAHYPSVLGTRKRAVARLDFTVDAAGKSEEEEADAQMIRDFLERDELQAEVIDMLDAIGKGFSVTEIIWDFSANLWTIKELKWRDPRWFEFDRNDGVTLRLRDIGGARDLTPYKYITHFHQSKSGLPVRGGVVRPCAWMYLFKNFSIKDWVIFAEAYGQPIRLGKYGAGASKEDREVLLRAIRNIGSDFGAIVPESMSIEFVESQGKTASADLFERLARFADEQMSKAVLGQTTTSDALAAGLAGNQAHNDVRGDICDSDAVQLAATLNKQLVVPYINLNRGERKKYPRIRIGRSERVDIEKESVVADRMIRAGAKISQKKMLERLNLPPAEGDDDVMQPLQTAAPVLMSAQPAALAKAATAKQGDAINVLAEQMSGDGEWQEVLNPLMMAVELALKDATTYEDFSEKLLQLAAEMDVGPAAEKIARSVFAARLAGNVGAKLK